MLQDILEERLTNDAVIGARFKAIRRELNPDLYVAVITTKKFDAGGALITQQVQKEIRDLVLGAISTAYKNVIILLIHKKPNEAPVEKRDTRLQTFLQIHGFNMGVSNLFSAPSQLRSHYLQALEAIKMGCRLEPDHNIFFYSDYAVYHAIEILSKERELGEFCHPVVRKLSHSKKASDHDLLETLYYYLHFSRDVTKACDQLHIHRSTLFYRINKLKELLGDDLYDGDKIFHILLSFRIAYYVENMLS